MQNKSKQNNLVDLGQDKHVAKILMIKNYCFLEKNLFSSI